VPKRFFKVILSPYANPPRGIGFIMNNGRVEGGMQAAAVSIDEVEKVTGHDFFSNLPDDVENAVESECRFHYWSTLK
jgi:endonuclease G